MMRQNSGDMGTVDLIGGNSDSSAYTGLFINDISHILDDYNNEYASNKQTAGKVLSLMTNGKIMVLNHEKAVINYYLGKSTNDIVYNWGTINHINSYATIDGQSKGKIDARKISGILDSDSILYNYGTIKNTDISLGQDFIFENHGKLTNDNARSTINVNEATFKNIGSINNYEINNNNYSKFYNDSVIDNSKILNKYSFYNGENNSAAAINNSDITNTGTIYNYGTIFAKNFISQNGSIENRGSITAENLISEGINFDKIENYGSLHANSFENSAKLFLYANSITDIGIMDNHSTINIDADALLNTNTLSNYSSIDIDGNLTTNSLTNNNGTITVNNLFNVQQIINNANIINNGSLLNNTINNLSGGNIENSITINTEYITNDGTIVNNNVITINNSLLNNGVITNDVSGNITSSKLENYSSVENFGNIDAILTVNNGELLNHTDYNMNSPTGVIINNDFINNDSNMTASLFQNNNNAKFINEGILSGSLAKSIFHNNFNASFSNYGTNTILTVNKGIYNNESSAETSKTINMKGGVFTNNGNYTVSGEKYIDNLGNTYFDNVNYGVFNNNSEIKSADSSLSYMNAFSGKFHNNADFTSEFSQIINSGTFINGDKEFSEINLTFINYKEFINESKGVLSGAVLNDGIIKNYGDINNAQIDNSGIIENYTNITIKDNIKLNGEFEQHGGVIDFNSSDNSFTNTLSLLENAVLNVNSDMTLSNGLKAGLSTVNINNSTLDLKSENSEILEIAAINLDTNSIINIEGGKVTVDKGDNLLGKLSQNGGQLILDDLKDTQKGDIEVNTGKITVKGDYTANNKTTIHKDAVFEIAFDGCVDTGNNVISLDENDILDGKIINNNVLNIENLTGKKGIIEQTVSNAVLSASGNVDINNFEDNISQGHLNINNNLNVSNGYIDAETNIESGANLKISGGQVILNGQSTKDKIDWNGDVLLDGGSLVLANINDIRMGELNNNGANLKGALLVSGDTTKLTAQEQSLINQSVADGDLKYTLIKQTLVVGDTENDTVTIADDSHWIGNLLLLKDYDNTAPEKGGNLVINKSVGTDDDTVFIANGGNLTISDTNTLKLNNSFDKILENTNISLQDGAGLILNNDDMKVILGGVSDNLSGDITVNNGFLQYVSTDNSNGIGKLIVNDNGSILFGKSSSSNKILLNNSDNIITSAAKIYLTETSLLELQDGTYNLSDNDIINGSIVLNGSYLNIGDTAITSAITAKDGDLNILNSSIYLDELNSSVKFDLDSNSVLNINDTQNAVVLNNNDNVMGKINHTDGELVLSGYKLNTGNIISQNGTVTLKADGVENSELLLSENSSISAKTAINLETNQSINIDKGSLSINDNDILNGNINLTNGFLMQTEM